MYVNRSIRIRSRIRMGYGRGGGKLTEFVSDAQLECVVEECGDEGWREADLKGVLRDYFATMAMVVVITNNITVA